MKKDGQAELFVQWHRNLDETWWHFIKQPVPTPPPFMWYCPVIAPTDHAGHDGEEGISPLQEKAGNFTGLGTYYLNQAATAAAKGKGPIFSKLWKPT